MSGLGDRIEPGGVAEAAARWFVRLQDEAATGDDWLAFEAWLAGSPEHATAYERIEQAWVDLDAAPSVAPAAEILPFPPPARPRATVSRRAWLAAAGMGLAASVTVGVLVADRVTTEPPAQTYVTAPGQTRDIRLADGTRMRLNAGSRLAVRFERHARRVEMADAEAAFDVTHDPDRPFLITAGDREVRVVGTEFNLRRREGAFALTVRRGVVEVRPTGRPEATPARVAAGHRLTHHEGASGAVLSPVQPDAAFGWTQRQLVYEAAPLREVAADLSRSLAAPVRVADTATGQLAFTGVLVLDDKEAVLKRLESFAPVRAEQRADGVVLTRR